MLDGEHVIVAEHAQRGGEFPPPFLAMAVAAGAEDPRAIALVGVALGIQCGHFNAMVDQRRLFAGGNEAPLSALGGA